MQILALQELYTGPTSRPLDVDAGHRLDMSSQCRGTVIHRRSSIHREVAIVERMILDLHREPPVVGIERWSLGDRPGLEHAVELKPEVVMQPPRVVLLDDEAPALGRNDPVVATGLGGLGEVPFSPVFRELALVEHEVHRTLRTRG
jgi:hypothetical protein